MAEWLLFVENGVMQSYGEVMANFRHVAGIRQNVSASRRNPANAVFSAGAEEVVIKTIMSISRYSS